jgi:hypothetical protein
MSPVSYLHRASALTAAAALTVAGTMTGASAAPTGAPTNTSTVTVHRSPTPTPRLVDIRTGRHPNFDRVVLDFRGAPPGYVAGYVNKVYADPSGRLIRLRGDASMMIRLKPAMAHRADGSLTYSGPDKFSTSDPNLRQVALAGDFEGVVSIALGLRHKAGFRVFTLRDPTRIVVDVAH